MDRHNQGHESLIQHLTWFFSQPEFYPPLIVAGLIALAVLIASVRFLFGRQFLSLSVLWLVVLVTISGLVSFFRVSQQNFQAGIVADRSASLSTAIPDVAFSVDPNFVVFGSIAIAFLVMFGFTKFRAALSPNLGARLALEGFVITAIVVIGMVLLGLRNSGVDTALGDVSFNIHTFKYPAMLCAGWLGIAVVYWGLAALKRKPSRVLSILQWLAYAAGLVLLLAPMTLTLLSASNLVDMDYQGQFEVWNRITSYGAYCIAGSFILLAALALLSLVRRTR